MRTTLEEHERLMLKPVDSGQQPPERPIGELDHELIEDGKAYARAEVDLVKAIATAKGKTYRFVLFGRDKWITLIRETQQDLPEGDEPDEEADDVRED